MLGPGILDLGVLGLDLYTDYRPLCVVVVVVVVVGLQIGISKKFMYRCTFRFCKCEHFLFIIQ